MGVVNRLPVDQALEQGATIVTANQRAARTLRLEFDRKNRSLGLESWRPAPILAWESWTASLWRSLLLAGHDSRLLLSRAQEHSVWRTVLEADEELATLRSVDSLAEMAAEGWQQLWSYNGSERMRRATISPDTRAFQRWARNFERTCRAEGFLTSAQLEGVLREAVEAGHLNIETGITFVGFDSMTPAQLSFIDALRNSGILIEELQPTVPAQNHILVTAEDESEELSVAARWIRTFLEEQPEAHIAVIVPALETQRAEIDRIFREILAPELEDIQTGSTPGPWEFSLGISLAKTPMVAAALDLLQWADDILPAERVSRLLLSPYFCMSPEELGPRAEFDAFALRKVRMLRPEISLEHLSEIIAKWKHRDTLGHLPAALRSMQRVITSWRDRGTHAEWAARIEELLEAAGWGSANGEDSSEFQTRRRWESALDELTTLDFDGVKINFAESLERLTRIAQQTIFAPESRQAPVQIMGPMEAAGTSFDALWFLHSGDLTWPAVATSSPLLPWHTRHELGMPGTDIALDSNAARHIIQRIAESAATVIFSFAKETSEGRQRVSPALAEINLKEIASTDLVPAAPEREIIQLEEIEDIPVAPLPDKIIHGGARILESQAACGFRAFAEQRLWSTELEPLEPGMDARERGTLVHRTLERFWQEVKTQSVLKTMTRPEREEMLDWCISHALHRAEELSETSWDAGYVTVQRERLQRLLGPWLELEMRRSPFEVKLSEKEFADVSVGPLRLNVRMDRVDVLEDGGEVLIDYKTGNASPGEWLTERPDAPQLPLYAILSAPETLQGVAFGLVRAGEDLDLKGYATHQDILPKTAKLRKGIPTLEAQVDEWRRVLTHLAEEFASGEARVAPKHYPSTCSRCTQRMLCRLDISRLEDEDEGSAEAPVHG